MSESVLPTHEVMLKVCAAAAPAPWYPKEYSKSAGISRDSFDGLLNDLRLSGLIKLTEWTKNLGQGYVLTELGQQVLANPVHLAQLRTGMERPSQVVIEEPVETIEEGSTPYEKGEAARNAFYEPDAPRIMPFLLIINLIAFGISIFYALRAGIPIGKFAYEGNPDVLHQLGALRAIDLVRGEWWRLFTCCFLHFGIFHLLANVISLWMLGQFESWWSPPRFLIIYLASGVGGSCAAMIWMAPGEKVVLAGASGAIWGVMTSMIAWFYMNRAHLESDRLADQAPNFAVLFAINIGISFLPGVSAAAHFGGGIVGFIVATLLHIQRHASPPRKNVAAVLLILLPFIFYSALVEMIDKDPRWKRVVEEEKERVQIAAMQRFKDEALPAIVKADDAIGAFEDNAYILTDKPPEQRPADAVAKMREDFKAARDLIKEARDKIGDKSPDEKLEATQKVALEYLAAAKALVEHMDGLFEKQVAWNKDERVQMVAGFSKARIAWNTARGQLQ